MQVTFWGVRGSTPCPSEANRRYGGNTACVSLEVPGEDPILLDLGTGLRFYGAGQPADGSFRGTALITHIHWDHVQGLPFFGTFYQTGWTPTIWAPVLQHIDVAFVDTIFQSPFFPIPVDHLPSRPGVQLIQPGEIEVEGFRIRVQPLTHPGGAFAYRITGDAGESYETLYAIHRFREAEMEAVVDLGRQVRRPLRRQDLLQL